LGTDARRERLRACTILLVDDEEANLDLLDALLSGEGYDFLVRTDDPREVPALVEKHAPDLVLLDLHMPHRHGLDVLQDLRALTSPGDYRPVLVLTADATWEAKERALALGARDFLTKPFDAMEVVLRVENLLETRLLHADQSAARERAEAAEGRSALIAEWSRLLAASLDPSTSFEHLPRLLVPRWADAAVVLLHSGEGVRPAAEVYADAHAEAWRAVLHAHAAAARPGATDVRVAECDGTSVAVVSAAIVSGESVVASIAMARDAARSDATHDQLLLAELARRASLAAEHARLFAAAERASQERERLLAVVAHDLRNPLGVVSMYAEMLASMQPEDGDAYTRAALATIHESTASMQRLVEDLLDVSTLRYGALRVLRTEQRIGTVMEEAERMLRPLAAARHVTLAVHAAAADADREIAIDAQRLVQVLSNLVGNAVKFTPPGGAIDVEYTVDEDVLAVAVTDTGPGIAPEDVPHIFTAFWQRDQRDRRGVGLGLWIARAIVESHGGRMHVESRLAEGTTFTFTLPFADPKRRWED
jgi:signal transduction histidine kinase